MSPSKLLASAASAALVVAVCACGAARPPPTAPKLTATTTSHSAESAYARVNGLNMYYEVHGAGEPLLLLHGGLGHSAMFGELLPRLAEHRKVIAVDLQAHGRTADIDRPLRYELMADDIAALIGHLGYANADIMGYSLGGGVALRTAIQHPQRVRRLVVMSAPCAQSGWYPEIASGMRGINGSAAADMRETPMYQSYVAVAPRKESFPKLLDKMGDLMSRENDWSRDIGKITAPTLLIYGDNDAVPPSHVAKFFELLGGGKKDAGWDGAGMSKARLAVLPGLTHYDIFISPEVAEAVEPFLAGGKPKRSWASRAP
jgi:pimeloyl-ACP methyl ester carboxylesterase